MQGLREDGGGVRGTNVAEPQARSQVADSRRLIEEVWRALEDSGVPAARAPPSQTPVSALSSADESTRSQRVLPSVGAFRPLHYYEGLSEAISEAIVRGSREAVDGPALLPVPPELPPLTTGVHSRAAAVPVSVGRPSLSTPAHAAHLRASPTPMPVVSAHSTGQTPSHHATGESPTQPAHPDRQLQELQLALQRALLEKNESLAREISLRRENQALRLQRGAAEAEQLMWMEQRSRQHLEALEEAERGTEQWAEGQMAVLSQQLGSLRRRLWETEQHTAAQQRALEVSAAELATSQQAVEGLAGQLREAEAELEAGQRNFAVVTEMWQRLEEENGRLQQAVAEKDRQAEELLQTIREGEAQRRALHIAVQELKGKVRVVCRMRPLLRGEAKSGGCIAEYVFPDRLGEGRLLEVVQPDPPKRLTFEFDRVFEPTVPQAEVYEEIAPLVQCALDGYHVCIFAYGQTGSGKTFTMEGPALEGEGRGVVPRAVAQVFDTVERLRCQGWTHRIVCQYLQLYNEAVHDLLQPSEDYHQAVFRPGVQSRHEIKHDANGRTIVTGLTELPVAAAADLHAALAAAAPRRAVGATQSNEASSRAHTILMLRIAAHNDDTGQRIQGVLNLIDLAGSERLRASGSSGEALRETQCINRSLSCLGDVVAAMVEKKEHVPFRNSKLTHLLKDYLSGDAKVLMFVNVSPADQHGPESICSLRFAQKVNACEVGLARSHAR